MVAALRGLKRRVDHERNAAVIGGYIAAVIGRAKDIPDLAEVLGWFEPRENKPQTAQQMVAAMRAWVAVTGGTFAEDTQPETPDAPEAEQ